MNVCGNFTSTSDYSAMARVFDQQTELDQQMSHLIYLFGVLHHFQHCTGHIKMGIWKKNTVHTAGQGSVL